MKVAFAWLQFACRACKIPGKSLIGLKQNSDELEQALFDSALEHR
jgi:hypothetical protein